MAEAAHSKFSASAASRWLNCPGSIVLSEGLKDSASRHAAEGTVAHSILEGLIKGEYGPALGDLVTQDGFKIEVTEEMLEAVNTAYYNILEMAGAADIVQAETRVNYSSWLGVPEADGWGTADCIVLRGSELQVHDYKHGKGVEVSAEENDQMRLYAGGALLEFEVFAEIETVRLVIHQPRINTAPSEWTLTVDELREWLNGRARSGAASVLNAENTSTQAGRDGEWEDTFLRPGEKQCRWCKAKATCPALRQEVAETVSGQEDITDLFEPLSVGDAGMDADVQWVAACLSKVDMIEDWCKAIRAEAERRLLAGKPVPGYKLVQGKRGARAWADPEAAEKMLREQFRLKVEDAYDLKLISPTSAEKLAKDGTIGPRQWKAAQALITQPEGRPHVAPADDKRPALEIKPVDELFEVQATDDDLANLV